MAKGLGGQLSYGQGSGGKFGPSGEFGAGTPGFGGSITYTIQLSKLLYDLGGPLSYVSTPMTMFPKVYSSGDNQGLFNSSRGFTIQSRVNAVNSYNSSTGASSPQGQLWVTPSGAVVTWGGQLISGPISM